MTRSLDLVLYGATGYTGQLVAEYLLSHAPSTLRWGVAGRSDDKLRQVTERLAQHTPDAKDLPRIVADADDVESLKKLAARTRVIVSTVGPYAVLGMPLVRAAAEAGTHYLDLTGEVQFIRRSIDECNELALQNGASLVHCCGFDCIPSDLGTAMLHQHLIDAGHGGLREATLYVESMRGGISGGTAASAAALFDQAASSRYVRELVADPYALSPDRAHDRGPDRDDDTHAAFDPIVREWTAPFVMAQVNTRVVRRSNALLGHPYGKDFRYSERSVMRGGALAAHGTALGMAAIQALGRVAPGRALIRRVIPAPGAGPSAEARERGGFTLSVRGSARDGARAGVRIVGKADPGYGETAKMLAEAALYMADRGPAARGVVTPAVAFGLPLLERLRQAGMDWDLLGA